MLGLAVLARAGLPHALPETPKTSPLLLGAQPPVFLILKLDF